VIWYTEKKNNQFQELAEEDSFRTHLGTFIVEIIRDLIAKLFSPIRVSGVKFFMDDKDE